MDDPDHRDECAVLGFAMVRAGLNEIAQLRKDPGPGRPQALEFQILKHADEQTVVALAAMLHALAEFPHLDFGAWSVVAAPRWPGRLGTAAALERYQADGARGVSPMAIPHLCLHSMSGTISLAFAMHGPNFGVGGGLTNVTDGLLTALGVQLEQQPPGTWVIFSEWDVEPGQTAGPPSACALALALGPVWQAPAARRLYLQQASDAQPGSPLARLPSLTDYLLQPVGRNKPWTYDLDWGMELVLTAGTKP